MRILHAIDTLDPADGGPPRVAIRLAVAQARLGHDVRLVHRRPAEERRSTVDEAIAEVPDHGRVGIIEIETAGIQPFAGRLRPEEAARLPSCDVVHIHGIWHPSVRAIAAWARERGVPYVVRPAGMLTRYSLAQKRWKKRLGFLLGYRAMIDRASLIQALNRDETEEMRPLRLRPPVEILPNGIFPEEIEPLPAAGSASTHWPRLAGRRYVLFVGRLHRVKGLDVLVEAFAAIAARHPAVDLVLAGPDGGEREALETRIAQLGIAERVHAVGPVYDQRKLALLVDADCFCLPSRHEAFSVAITEAAACGKPCVISESAHFPEIAEVGAGRVVPFDATAFAEALHALLADPALRAEQGRRARELVHARFTWPAVASRSIDLYKRYIEPGA